LRKANLEEKEFEDRMDYALDNDEFEIYVQGRYSIFKIIKFKIIYEIDIIFNRKFKKYTINRCI